jgi:ATP-binding cassette, subfamily B, bacterial PglK
VNTYKKLQYLLTPDQRRAASGLLALMFVGMILETLGIGLVIPAITLMTDNDIGRHYPVLQPWLARIGNPSHARLVIIGMSALIAVYATKASFLGLLAWMQSRFVFRLQAALSSKVFAGYLRQPYIFHLQRNSAQLIRTTIYQIDEIRGVVQMGLLLIAEGMVLLGILGLLLAVEPVGTLVVLSVLGMASYGFERGTRTRLKEWGVNRQRHEELRLKHLQEGLGGAKDVKLLGRESDFLAEYSFHNRSNARIGEMQATLQALPRLWLELLAVSGLGVLVFVMVAQGKSSAALLPALGLFAAAAFRVMPSVTRILNTAQSVQFSLPAIDSVYGEVKLIEATLPPTTRGGLLFRRTLDLKNVTFRYPATEQDTLKDIGLSIERGSTVGFVGPSGGGKSTLIDIILGLLSPASGSVNVDGVDIQNNLRGWQDQIGYVPQSIFLTDDTLRRNIAFGLRDGDIDDAAVLRAVRAAQLHAFVNELPGGLETLVGERGVRLSGGQRQRIGIARALYHDPAVLVLDEATSSLDTETESGVMDAVAALHGDKTIIIVAHRLSTVEQCDRLFRIEQGRISAAANPEQILSVGAR